MFFIYLLYSEKFDRYYVGSTENVESALHRHNGKMLSSTKNYSPWVVEFTEQFLAKAEAVTRENRIKKYEK